MGPVEADGVEPVLRATGGSEEPLSISDTEDRTGICFISCLVCDTSQDFDELAVFLDLFTHTVEHAHVTVSGTSCRLLHKVKKQKKKQKRGQKSRATTKQKANAGAKTLLREKKKENRRRKRRREKWGGELWGWGKRKKQTKQKQKNLADSSPLHTPVVSRRCSEDEEG